MINVLNNLGSKKNLEVIVFLHYFGGSSKSWNWVIEEISTEFRCLAINLPGFGGYPPLVNPSIQNYADYVRAELTYLGITNYTLVGHSMGGKIATQVCIDVAKGAVKNLILVAPSPPTTEPLEEDDKKHMLDHPNILEAKRSVNVAVKKPLTVDQYNLAVENQLVTDEKTWRWWILKGMHHSIGAKAALLKLPIFILASNDDPIITPKVIKERVTSVFKNATLITTSEVGHLIPLELSGWISQNIRKILHQNKPM